MSGVLRCKTRNQDATQERLSAVWVKCCEHVTRRYCMQMRMYSPEVKLFSGGLCASYKWVVGCLKLTLSENCIEV